MSDLLILYGAVGVACGVAVLRRSQGGRREAVLSALIAIPLWPLWAPFVLLQPTAAAAPAQQQPTGPSARTHDSHPAQRRIQRALQGVRDAARVTGLESLLTPRDAEQIMMVVSRVCARLDELDQQLQQHAHVPPHPSSRGEMSERALAASERRRRSVARLRGLRDHDAAALDELAELCELLQAELLLARYGAAEDLANLKSELVARLDALAAV